MAVRDFERLTRSVEKLKPFVVVADWTPGALADRGDLRARLAPAPEQLSLF